MLTATMVGVAALASPFVVLGSEAYIPVADRIDRLADKPVDDNASQFTKVGLTGLKTLKTLVTGTNDAIASIMLIPLLPFFGFGAPLVALLASTTSVWTAMTLSVPAVVGSVSDSNLCQVLGAATIGQGLGMTAGGILALGLKRIVAHRNGYRGYVPDFEFALHPAVLLPSAMTRLGITFVSASAAFGWLGG